MEPGSELETLFEGQRRAFARDGAPSKAWRAERLDRVVAMVQAHQQEMIAAVREDFGSRPEIQSRLEIMSIADAAKYAKKRLGSWMKPERASVPLPMRMVGGRARIVPQPLGVVGIVSPWNYPFQIALTPLVAALAAGCRAMIKPSELTPRSNDVLQRIVGEYFSPEEVVVVQGGVEVAKSFTALDFDHLIFTGSPAVGRHVMRSAADTLTPVTLELGGKCPVVIDPQANIATAAERTLSGKMQNSGQICLCPDTAFVPRAQIEQFITEALMTVSRQFPTIAGNPDVTSIIDAANFDRLCGYLDECEASGVRIEPLVPQGEEVRFAGERKLAPTLVIDPPEHVAIAREEIFGPLLVIRSYDAIDEAIEYITARPRPLALYYFGSDRTVQARLERETHAGGMTVNDVIMHAGIESLPFGGIGNSGMGAYHGKYGFDTFSHRKPVFTQGFYSLIKLFAPPYTRRHAAMLDRQFPVRTP